MLRVKSTLSLPSCITDHIDDHYPLPLYDPNIRERFRKWVPYLHREALENVRRKRYQEQYGESDRPIHSIPSFWCIPKFIFLNLARHTSAVVWAPREYAVCLQIFKSYPVYLTDGEDVDRNDLIEAVEVYNELMEA